MNIKSTAVLIALCMLSVSCLIGIGYFGSEADLDAITDPEGKEIDTTEPYHTIIKDGKTTYYQAVFEDNRYYLVSPTSTTDEYNYSMLTNSGEYTPDASYYYNNYEIMTDSSFDEADLIITIPEGTILSCFNVANLSNSGKEQPHGVEFSDGLKSITIAGAGTLTSGSGSEANIVIGFNGVPTKIDGITLSTKVSTIYGGSVAPGADLDSTFVTIENLNLNTGTNIVAGSRHSDVGTTNIIVNNLTITSGTASIYGGNLNTQDRHGTLGIVGDVTESNVTVSGGSMYAVFGGGAGESKVTESNVKITGGTIARVFGGGNSGSEVQNTNVNVGGTAVVSQRVFGGGWGSDSGITNVTVTGGEIVSDVVGGGFENSKTESANIEITGGTIGRGVVAGGLAYTQGNTSTTGAASIVVSGGVIGTDQDEERGIRDYADSGKGKNSLGNMNILVTGGVVDSIKVKTPGLSTDIEVSGGTFVELIDESWVADGFEITVDENGNVVIVESHIPPIIWDDDDEYIPPIVPVQPQDSGGDSVTVVACAAAAVVAALMAAFLILDRKR